jgi:hypothetical protein
MVGVVMAPGGFWSHRRGLSDYTDHPPPFPPYHYYYYQQLFIHFTLARRIP